MSDEGASYWLKLAEKVVGLILLILGSLIIYITVISTDNLGVFSWLFGALSVVLLIVAVFILIAKSSE